MKQLKPVFLAGVAAILLITSAGAGSASATVLCAKTPAAGTDCAAGDVLNLGSFVQASVENSVLLKTTGGATIATCTVGSLLGSISNTGGTSSTVTLNITTKMNEEGQLEGGLTWGLCNTTVDTLKGGSLEVHHISGTDNGTVTSFGTEFTVNLTGISCSYGTGSNTDIGVLTGGNPGTLDVEGTIPKVAGGFLCPGSAVWSGAYKITTPSSTLDVAAG